MDGSATLISIFRNAGLGVPVTVSRHENAAPACASVPLRLADRRRGLLELRRGESVLRHPKRERARLQRRGAVGTLRDAAKTGGQRHGQDRQCDQDLDQRESGLAAECARSSIVGTYGTGH